MIPQKNNLFDNVPKESDDEIFDTIVKHFLRRHSEGGGSRDGDQESYVHIER